MWVCDGEGGDGQYLIELVGAFSAAVWWCPKNCKVIDVVRNSQGEGFMDFLRSIERCAVNGRKGKDAFTCVSGRGCSGVDYRVVGVEDFDMIENFRITTMCEAVEEMRSDGVSMMVPDNSLLRTSGYCAG